MSALPVTIVLGTRLFFGSKFIACATLILGGRVLIKDYKNENKFLILFSFSKVASTNVYPEYMKSFL